jgi:hypothetical protein
VRRKKKKKKKKKKKQNSEKKMRSGPKLLTWAQTPPLVAAAFLGCGASVAVQSLPSSVLALGRPLDVLGAYFATVVVFALACGVVLDRRTLAVTAKTPPAMVAPALRAAPLSSLMPAIAALSAWSVTIGSAVLLFASGRIGYTAPTSHGGGSGGGDGGGSSGSSGDGSGGAAPPAPPVVDPTWGWTGLVLVGAGLGCLMVVLPSLVGSARVRPRVPGQPASRGGRSPLFAWFVAAAAMAKFAGEFAWPFLGAEVSQASALSVTPAVCAAGALVLSVLAWRARRSHTENAASRHALLHPELLSDNLDDVITTNTNGNNINSNTSTNTSSNTNTNINTDTCVDGNRNNINSGCCHSTGTRSNSHSSLNIVDSDHPNSINSTAAAANKVHCVSRSDSCGGTGAARASDAGRCPHPAPPVIVIDVPGAGKAASAAGRCPDGDGSAAAGPAASSSTRDPYATPTRCPLLKRSTMLTFAVRVAGPLVPVFYVMALLTDLAMPMQGFGLNGVVAGHPLKPWVMPSMPLFTTALWCVLFELAPRFRGPARPTPRSRLLAGAALVAASSLFAAALAGAAQPSLSVLAQLPQHLCLGAGAALISVAAFEAACDGTGHTALAAQAAAATTNAATANAATANAATTNAASPAAFSLALPAGAPACPYRRCPVAITGGTVRLALLAASHAAAALASGAVGTRMPWLEDIARPAAFLAHAGIAAAGGAALWGFGVWEGR